MENNFDKYFKEKLENRKFEMKPKYWEGAEALIEADQSGKGWRRFLMWFVGVLLLGVVIFGVWKKTDGETSAVALDGENAKIENTISEKENNQLGKNLNESNDVSENKNEKQNEVVENSFSNNLNQNNIGNNKVSKSENEIAEALEENKSVSNSSNLKIGTEKPSNPNSSFSNSNLNQKTPANFANQNVNQTSLEKNNLSAEQAGKTITNEGKVNELDFPKIKNALNTPNANSENSTLENSKTDEVKTETETEKIKPVAEVSPFVPSIELFLDGKKIEDLNLECAYLGKDKKDKWMFGATAGVVGYPLIENSSTQPFIGAKGGFVVERNFKTKKGYWTIGSELLYHFRSGNFIVSKKNENRRYSFGRTTTVDELTPKNLHYLELPIYLKYHWNKVNFEAGGSVNYLMGVRGEVNQNEVIEKGWTPISGFKKYHANVLLGVHYQLSENIRFGLRANYTPNGILENNPDATDKILRESGPLYLTFKVTQFLK